MIFIFELNSILIVVTISDSSLMVLVEAINAINMNVGVFLNSLRKQMKNDKILAIIPIQ